MLFQVIAMSVITLLLFFLLLTRKPGRINLLLGACTTVCGIASMVLAAAVFPAAHPQARQDQSAFGRMHHRVRYRVHGTFHPVPASKRQPGRRA